MTPKQQRFVEDTRVRAVQALRMIARHIGMLPLTPEVAEKNRAGISDEMLTWALWTLVSDVSRSRRTVAMLLLDLVSPDWRDVAGPEIMGHAVKRSSPLVRKWRTQVLANDNGACRHCGSTDDLNAHHIVRWADDPAMRLVPDNGMTLCKPCHDQEHRLHG